MPDTIIPVTEPEPPVPAAPSADAQLQESLWHELLRKISSFQVLLGAILVSGVFVAERSMRLDPDTWWHIRVGSDILATRQFPVVDHYSFTARGAAWIAYEWLGDVVMSLASRSGLRGTELLLVASSSLITLLIYYYAWLKCKECKAAFLATAAIVPLAMLSMTVRPQLFGYVFLLVTLICLERFRQGHRQALWFLPPVFLLWVNTHGSFVLGFMAMGLYWACGLVDFSWGGLHADRWALRDRIRLELAALICLLMLPITPYGTRLATVPVEYAFSLPGNMAHIQEWQPADFSQWQVKLFLGLVLLLVFALLTLRLRLNLVETSFFLFATYETCVHVRFAIVFAIIFAPLLAALIARWVDPYNRNIDKYALNAVLILGMAVAWVRYFPSRADLEQKVAANYPVEAVRYLRQHPLSGPMLNSYGFGGYLIWAGMPRQGVFIDGRGDLYERTGVFADFRRIVNLAPETRQLLRGYGIQSCLLQRGTPLATFLGADPHWNRVYQDDVAGLYVRDVGSGKAGRSPNTVQTSSGGLN
ncbi:MAG TPA: hypothetical protein VNG91_07425 [Terriglobia bacterium]|nr:hypothetical protein [Terriglobia bacterium]